jgi:hypothetical protein
MYSYVSRFFSTLLLILLSDISLLPLLVVVVMVIEVILTTNYFQTFTHDNGGNALGAEMLWARFMMV